MRHFFSFGVVFILHVINSNSYYLSLTPLQWKDASNYCHNHCNSQLASIHTKEEYLMVKELISNSLDYINNPIWIGLHSVDNVWKWMDGTFLNIEKWETDTSVMSTCAVIEADIDYKWSNTECNDKYPFLCDHCDGVLTKYVSPNIITKTSENAESECNALYDTSLASIDSDSISEATLTGDISVSDEYWVNAADHTKCTTMNVVDGISVDRDCDDITDQAFLCQYPSEICSIGNRWRVIKGNENALELDINSCELDINSMDSDTITIIDNKQWKTCNRIKPWIVEMKYRTLSPGKDSKTGMVFYIDATLNDHYFVRVHPILGEFNLGYVQDGKEENIVSGHGLPYKWNDNEWEVLRVEILYGSVFHIYLNGKLYIKTNTKNPFKRTFQDAMSGYVGIQTIFGNIEVKTLYISGMPVFDGNEKLMKNCKYSHSEADKLLHVSDVMIMRENPTFKPDHDTTNIEAIPEYGGFVVDTNGDEVDTLNVNDNGGVHGILIFVILIVIILCCMIIVAIYYLKLMKKRKRKKNLRDIFGEQNDNISNNKERKTTINDIVDDTMDADLNGLNGIGHRRGAVSAVSTVMNTWDVMAIEINCDNILKNNRRKSFS